MLGTELPSPGSHSRSSSGVLDRPSGTPGGPLSCLEGREPGGGPNSRISRESARQALGPSPGETLSGCFLPTPALPAGAWTGKKGLFITHYLPGQCSLTRGTAQDLAMGVLAEATDTSPGGHRVHSCQSLATWLISPCGLVAFEMDWRVRGGAQDDGTGFLEEGGG